MSVRPNTIGEIENLDEWVQDLLVERTLWGLDPAQETELSVAVSDVDSTSYEFERAAGALCVGMLATQDDPMPAALRERLGALAETDAVRSITDSAVDPRGGRGLDSNRSDSGPIPFSSAQRGDSAAATAVGGVGGVGALQWFGWIAAAACLTYAMFVTTPASGPVPGGLLPNLVARVEGSGDVIRAGWAGISAIGAENHPLDGGVTGEVVWSDDLDQGFMTISGIEANDPTEYQYQLWIFDAERPTGDLPRFAADSISPLLTQRPVDGGVFDVSVSDSGEFVVPIDAKLPVGKAAIFAVTKERPGGVVVSDRDIVFLALRG